MNEGLRFQDSFDAEADAVYANKRELLLVKAAEDVGLTSAHPVLFAPVVEDTEDVPVCESMTIAQHLEQGRMVSDRRQRMSNARTQRLADKRAYHWRCLMQSVRMICGEELMLKCTLPEPDMGFTYDTERVQLTFRPFNRSTFSFVMACQLRRMENESRDYESPWSLVQGVGHKPFVVHQDWRPASDECKWHEQTRVFTVSEAVHLTYLQSESYDDALVRHMKMRHRDAAESKA
jgi:hypothetical protein